MPRKQHTYHFIYKTVNQVNGKFYIGMHSTSNLEDGYIGSGKRLWYSIRKYGRENFIMEIQEFLADRHSLKDREKEIVNEGMLQDPMCMNLAIGGHGGFINKEAAAAGGRASRYRDLSKCQHAFREKFDSNDDFRNSVIEKIKTTHFEKTGSNNGWKGRKHNDEFKKNISEKNSISQRGEKNSQFGLKWIHNIELRQNKRIRKEEEVPDGWKLGRKMKWIN